MNKFQALEELLRYRNERYLSWPVDWRDFPIFNSNTFDPLKIKKRFNWVTDVSGLYAHKPPYAAQVDVVHINPFGIPEITIMTCETAGKLHTKTREKINYNGCTSASTYMTKWSGSPQAKKLITRFLEYDNNDFSFAFLNALGLMYSDLPINRRIPKLNIKLTFPLPESLPGGKLINHLEVLK